MNHRLAILVGALLTAACGPSSNTVFVDVCGDVQIPQDIDAVRISILNSDRSDYRTGTLELIRCTSEDLALPQETELEAPFGDIWITAQGLQDGVEVLRSERRMKIEDSGPAQTAFMWMTRSCMRVDCSLGQTCIKGECEQAPFAADEIACSGGAPSEGVGGGTKSCEGAP